MTFLQTSSTGLTISFLVLYVFIGFYSTTTYALPGWEDKILNLDLPTSVKLRNIESPPTAGKPPDIFGLSTITPRLPSSPPPSPFSRFPFSDLFNNNNKQQEEEKEKPSSKPTTFSLASFNIRNKNINDIGNMWDSRRDGISQYIHTNSTPRKTKLSPQNSHNFDIILFQEVLPEQLTDLQQRLPSSYGWISRGRTSKGNGEACTIAYNQDRFLLLFSDHFWLTSPDGDDDDNQDNNNNGNISLLDTARLGWDSNHLRIVTYGIFYDTYVEKIIIIVNSHWDHRGQLSRLYTPQILISRIYQIQLLLLKNKNLKLYYFYNLLQNQNQNNQNMNINEDNMNDINYLIKNIKIPVILGGDFNVNIHSIPYRVLINSKVELLNEDNENDNNNNYLIPPYNVIPTNHPQYIDDNDNEDTEDIEQEKDNKDDYGFFTNTITITNKMNNINNINSFNGFKYPKPLSSIKDVIHIDHIMISTDNIYSNDYKKNNEYGQVLIKNTKTNNNKDNNNNTINNISNCHGGILSIQSWTIGDDAIYYDNKTGKLHTLSDHWPIYVNIEWK